MYIKGCIAHLCHSWSWSGRSLCLGNQWECWYPELGPNVVRPPVPHSPIIPLYLFPLDGGKSGKRGFLVVDTKHHIRGLKDSWESAFSWLVSPHLLGLYRICLPFPSLPSPPSTCGSCPFTLGSGLIPNFFFGLVHFGPFVNNPPGPEIYFINLSLAGSQQWVQRDLVSPTACPSLELHQVSLAGEGS